MGLTKLKNYVKNSLLRSAERATKKMNRSSFTCGTIPGGLTYDFCLQRREREAEKKIEENNG